MAINLERFVKAKRFTEDHVLDDASDQILVKVATDSVAGKVALNAGTSLPGDATNCTDALTACGLNALLADPAAGGNTVINGIKALIPLATTTVAGLIEEATGEETRLGATDANRADRAVTPESMSYALQTAKDYKIKIEGSGTTSVTPMIFAKNTNTSSGKTVVGRFEVSGTGPDGTNVVIALMGGGNHTAPSPLGSPLATGITALADCDVSASAHSAAVYGVSIATGPGLKAGFVSSAYGAGGTNYGVYAVAQNGATNWAFYGVGNGLVTGSQTASSYITSSDETLKENVEDIDAAKALQFRNGLSWKKYELFSEQQVEIMQTVTDGEGNETQVPTGRYEVKRNSQGIKRGLIAQEVLALAQSIGDFSDVVVEVGEYFTLDAQGYPVKDAQGNNIVNKRLGLDYDAIQFVICAGEQSLLPAVV